jgi:hypothetical protein
MEEKIINGIKYRLDEETLTAEVIRKRGYSGDIVIPETVVNQNVLYKVTCIDASAFAKCASLTSVAIPTSVTTIGDETFKDCSSLTTVNIPNSLTTVGFQAFGGCESLKSITFKGTINQWKEIDCTDEDYVVHCIDGIYDFE